MVNNKQETLYGVLPCVDYFSLRVGWWELWRAGTEGSATAKNVCRYGSPSNIGQDR